MKVSFNYKGQNHSLELKPVSRFSFGLMFKPKNTQALLFDFKKPVNLAIHSIFVFFPFVALWIDGYGQVIEAKKVMPFTFSTRPKKDFIRLVEIPINKNYRRLLKPLGFLDERKV